MMTYVSLLLIVTVVATVLLKQALAPAQFVQHGKPASPETLRAGGAVVFSQTELIKNRKSKIENLKRLLYFIRGVYIPHADKLPQEASQWGKSCIARATAMYGNVYGLAASGRALTAYPKNEQMIGAGEANRRITRFGFCSHSCDYNRFAPIENRKSKIENRLLWLPVRIIRQPKQGILEQMCSWRNFIKNNAI